MTARQYCQSDNHLRNTATQQIKNNLYGNNEATSNYQTITPLLKLETG